MLWILKMYWMRMRQGNTNYKVSYVDTKTKKVYSNIKSVTFSNYKKIMTDIVDSNERSWY